MTGKNALRACPLAQCGGEALLVFAATGGAYIECQNCELTTRVVDDAPSDDENAKLVTDLWNTRASGWEDAPSLREVVEMLANFDARNSIVHLRELARDALAKSLPSPPGEGM